MHILNRIVFFSTHEYPRLLSPHCMLCSDDVLSIHSTESGGDSKISNWISCGNPNTGSTCQRLMGSGCSMTDSQMF